MAVSSSAYYAWCQSAHKCPKAEQDHVLAKKLRQLFSENRGVYGSRRLTNILKTQGIQVGRYKVRRLMQDLNLVARYPKRVKVMTDSNHSESISSNKLDRKFRVS